MARPTITEMQPGQGALKLLRDTMPGGDEPVLPSHNIKVELKREKTRDEGIQGLVVRASRLTNGRTNVRAASSLVDLPEKSGVKAQVVVTGSEAWAHGQPVTDTTVEIWQHHTPSEATPRTRRTRVLAISADIIKKGEESGKVEIERERVTHFSVPNEQEIDWGTAMDLALSEAGDAVDAVEGGIRGGRKVRRRKLVETGHTPEADYSELDRNLEEITFKSIKANGENPGLKAFTDWCNRHEAEAEVAYLTIRAERVQDYEVDQIQESLADAKARLKNASDTIDGTLKTGGTFYPDTYNRELKYLDSIALDYTAYELSAVINQILPTDSREHSGSDRVVDIREIELQAQMHMVQTLRNRQALIATGELQVPQADAL